jgi:hypothetical protein
MSTLLAREVEKNIVLFPSDVQGHFGLCYFLGLFNMLADALVATDFSLTIIVLPSRGIHIPLINLFGPRPLIINNA